MTQWKARRFWTEARPVQVPGGWGVNLDSRPLRTPAKAALVVPTRALAEGIAAEWNAQEGEIAPRTMPLTRASNSAIDKVTPQRAEVAELLAAYGETDLLCHRADAPAALVARQAHAWDPLLAWAAEDLGAPLTVTTGIISVGQPEDSLRRLRALVDGLDPFRLTGFHDLVALSGSLIIGLATLYRPDQAEDHWQASRVDELWQAELWGRDEEAESAAELKRSAFLEAVAYLDLLARAD